MMSATEYRARAAALIGSADDCSSYDLILELETTAQEWRRLADMADWQEQILATLAALGATPRPAPRDEL
jgi:hypothetical protein